MSGKMKEPVNAIQGKLGRDIVTKLPGAPCGDGGTDEDLSIRKRDHIRCSRDAEKLAMDPGHGTGTHHCEFDLIETPERPAHRVGNFQAKWERDRQ